MYNLCLTDRANESEVKTFLEENHESIKYECNFKRKALLNARAVNRGECKRLDQYPVEDANQYMFLINKMKISEMFFKVVNTEVNIKI